MGRAAGGTEAATAVLTRRIGEEILVVSLNRPARRNAVDPGVTAGLEAAVRESEQDPKLRVVILTGADGGGFCAGIDLDAVSQHGTGPMVTKAGGFAGFVYAERNLPWIAAVEGAAFGGGFELALTCEMIVAARDARFGQTEIKRGLAAFGGGMFRLPRAVPRQIANEMLLTGDPIDATRAFNLGLVNAVSEPGMALDQAISLAQRVCLAAPGSVRETLRIVRMVPEANSDTLIAASREASKLLSASCDASEGIAAFLERRRPKWQGK